MNPIYSNSLRCTNSKLTTIGDCLDKLKAFDAIKEANASTSSASGAACGSDPLEQERWRKNIREGIVWCGGDPMDLDFFQAIANGPTKRIGTKDIYIRQQCDTDLNIYAERPVTGSAPGASTTFQVLRSQHSLNGKNSRPAEGYMIYIYEDEQWVYIDSVDKTTDYGHLVTVIPLKKDYTVNIRRNSKMMLSPARAVNGLSCPKPSSSFATAGFSKKVSPFRLRRDFCLPIDFLRGYQDILTFAIMFDPYTGEPYDCWDAYERITARKDLKFAKNLIFFLGQSADNPALLDDKLSMDYGGFEGYVPSIKYGGGTVLPYDPGKGFDLEADFEALLLRNDSLKRVNEYIVLHSTPFSFGLQRSAQKLFAQSSGRETFASFTRMGDGGVKRLGIKSYEYMGFTLHFKKIDAFSDQRVLGNHQIPHMAMFVPGTGLKDTNGNAVPPIEFFVPEGCKESGEFEEHIRDMRKINGCETIEGHIAETIMMAVHCPKDHIFLQPEMGC